MNYDGIPSVAIMYTTQFVVFVIEALYYNYLFTPKLKRVPTIGLYFLLCSLLLIPGMLTSRIKLIFTPIYYFGKAAYAWVMHKDRSSKKAIGIIMLNLFFFISEYFILFSTLPLQSLESAALSIVIYALLTALFATLSFMFAYYFKTLEQYNIGKRSFAFILLPISQLMFFGGILLLDSLNDLSDNIMLKTDYNPNVIFSVYFAAVIIISFIIDIIVFRGFVENIKLHDTELKLKSAEYQNEANLRYYTDLQENAKSMRKIKHDFLNILQIMHTMKESDEKADSLFAELESRIRSIRFQEYCKNSLINAIISSKLAENSESIEFEIKVDSVEKTPLSDFDLCRVATNMLDNAIEACRNNDGEARNKITLEMFEREGYFYIVTENPLHSSDIDFAVSSKADKKEHGLGIGILKEISHNYDGEYIITTNQSTVNAIFTAAV